MAASKAKDPVFLITHEFYPRRGGIATFAEEIALAATKLGHDLEVWAQHAGKHREKDWPFHIHRMPLKGTHDLSCQCKLACELIKHRRRLRYATVYLPEPGPMLTLMRLQFLHALRPKKIILTFHGSEILKFHNKPVTRWLTRRLLNHAHRVSVLTKYTHDLLTTHFPSVRPKLVMTPGALRSDFFANEPTPRPASEKLVVLTVGRLHPRKGQIHTLEALINLPAELRSRVEYWIVGGHSKENYQERLQELASTSDITVRFLGDLSDAQLDEVYDKADIFAMTSINHGHSVEGFGLVYLEAAAHGIPIIAHEVGGVSEAVDDGETGILVNPHSPAELTAAFEKLIRDPELRLRLGMAGIGFARKNRWEHSADLLFNNDLPSSHE